MGTHLEVEYDRTGLLAMAGNFAGAVLRHAADGCRIATAEVQAGRKRACGACPHFKPDPGQCLKCGCSTLLDLKRSWASERCPDDPPRWTSV